jgi:hypothetical protein
MHFPVSVNSAALKPRLFDLGNQLRVFLGPGRLRAATLGVIPTGVNIQGQAHPLHRVLLLMVLDKRVPHPDALAK